MLGSHPEERENLFLQACLQNLQKGIEVAVARTNQRITCVIADAFVTPSLLLAQDLNVPWIAICVGFSVSLGAHFHTDLILQKCKSTASGSKNRTLDFLPGLSKIRSEDLPDDIFHDGEKETLFSKTLGSLGRVLPQAKAVVINFYMELDPSLFVQDMKSKLQSMLYDPPSLSFPQAPLPPSEADATRCLS